MKAVLISLLSTLITIANAKELPNTQYSNNSPIDLIGASLSGLSLKVNSTCESKQIVEAKGKSDIVLNRMLSEKEVGEISGLLFDGSPTDFFLRTKNNSFYELPEISSEKNEFPLSLTYYYKVDLSNKVMRLSSSDCEFSSIINQLEFGNRFILKVKIHSSNFSDLKNISENIHLRKRQISLMSLVETLKEFPLENLEDLAIQLNWSIQTEDYQSLLSWNAYLSEEVGVFYCFVDDESSRGCGEKIQKFYSFLFKNKNNFMDSMLYRPSQDMIVPYKISVDESFSYTSPEGMTNFYKEKIYLNKLEELFSLKLFYVESDGAPLLGKSEILSKVKSNKNLFDYYSVGCHFYDGKNEQDVSEDCQQSYQNYSSSHENIGIDLGKIKLLKGFYFYCLQSDENSTAFMTVKALQRYFNTTSCEEIKDMAASIASLDLSSMQISDLSTLIDFVNLEKINLKYNLISEYSILEKLHNLVDIDLSFNQISGLYVLKTDAQIERFRIYSNLFNSTEEEIEAYRKQFNIGTNAEFYLTDEQLCKGHNIARFSAKNPQYMIYLNRNGLVDVNGVISPCSMVVGQL